MIKLNAIILNSHCVFILTLGAISPKCVTCKRDTTGAHSCKICKEPCHAIDICAAVLDAEDEEEGFGSKALCRGCSRDQGIDCSFVYIIVGTVYTK